MHPKSMAPLGSYYLPEFSGGALVKEHGDHAQSILASTAEQYHCQYS